MSTRQASVDSVTGSRWRALTLPLATLAVFALGVAVLLAFSPLNEMPDTYCQTVLSPPGDDVCSEVVSRRWQWIAVVLAVAGIAAVLAVLVRHRYGRARCRADA